MGLLTQTAEPAREILGVETIDVVADRGYFKAEDIEARPTGERLLRANSGRSATKWQAVKSTLCGRTESSEGSWGLSAKSLDPLRNSPEFRWNRTVHALLRPGAFCRISPGCSARQRNQVFKFQAIKQSFRVAGGKPPRIGTKLIESEFGRVQSEPPPIGAK
jgi:hypothetical protein